MGDSLYTCTVKGDVIDEKGNLKYRLRAKKSLGKGTFSHVDLFEQKYPDGTKKDVALKRANHNRLNFYQEALFQKSLHINLKAFRLSFCVPEVYDILRFQQSGSVFFLMEPFEPLFLDKWLEKQLQKQTRYFFATLLLQIALILEVFEEKFSIDHRDIKTNNMIIVEEEVKVEIVWKEKRKRIVFPFRIVFLDFGYACQGGKADVKKGSSLPPIDPCPKLGRDFYQVLASIWNKKLLRTYLEATFWGNWIRERLETCTPHHGVHKIETSSDLGWLTDATDLEQFIAPLCAPSKVITDCMTVLEEHNALTIENI
jgi:serine/threonine protein kinase